MFVIRMKTIMIYLTVLVTVFCTVHFCLTRPAGFPVHAEAEPEEGAVTLPILMYHAITEDPKRIGQFVISKKMFEEDLQFLQAEGYHTVTVDEVIDFVKNDGDLPDKPVLLTFDDGYYNNYCYAYPLLQKYEMKAVISLIGKYTDLYTDTPDENPGYSHITWDEVNEMIQSGLVEFQNHSYDLHSNTKGRNGAKKKWGESKEEYARFLKEDIDLLQNEMREHTGYTPTTFAYPFGSVSEDSYEILENMGFQATLSCEEKLNYIKRGDTDCLRTMNRYLRSNKASAKSILSKALPSSQKQDQQK